MGRWFIDIAMPPARTVTADEFGFLSAHAARQIATGDLTGTNHGPSGTYQWIKSGVAMVNFIVNSSELLPSRAA